MFLSTRKRKQHKQLTEQAGKKATTVNFVNDDHIEKVLKNGVNVLLDSACENPKLPETPGLSGSVNKRRKARNEEHEELSAGHAHEIRGRKIKKTSECDSKDGDEENQSCNLKDISEKPFGLCDEDDVAGGDIFSFQTPKKGGAMMQKAVDSANKNKSALSASKNKCKTPLKRKPLGGIQTRNSISSSDTKTQILSPASTPNKISKVSKIVQDNAALVTKTPYSLRTRKKQLIQECKRLQTEDTSDIEDSNYCSSSSSDSEVSLYLSENDDDSDSGKGSENAKPPTRRSLRYQNCSTLTPGFKGKDLNYVFTPDEYFHCQSSKLVTSNSCLSRLSTPQLDTSTLLSLLKQCSVSASHQQILASKRKIDWHMFEHWMVVLSRGFNILAYGLGSKYNILQRFRDSKLNNSHVLVVNGFFPGVTIKEILEMIATDLLGVSLTLPSPHAILDHMERMRWMPRVFLIVHNLDAEMLRHENAQHILSRLASLPKVHLIASVDHINCPLLWDQETLSNFNFVWEDTTSFLPYQEETSYETNLMVQNSGSLAVTSLLNVYRSLPKNSQGVLRIILGKHLDNNQNYKGVAFSDLYRQCREEMLVANDLALRTMLTEFLDHQMVKWRKDGELLHMPSDISVLQAFQKLIL